MRRSFQTGRPGVRLALPAMSVLRRIRMLPVSIGYSRAPVLASWLRKRWVRFRNPHATIVFGPYTYLGPGVSLHMPHGGTFITHQGVEFRRNFRAELAGPQSRIEIGAGSVFTYDVIVQCATTIEIGTRCMFGQATLVVDGNHRYRDLDTPMLNQGYDLRPIRIADDVTVTTKCTIIADIGTRAFIGANALVTKPVPAYTVNGGVPSRVLDYFGPDAEAPPVLSEANSDSIG